MKAKTSKRLFDALTRLIGVVIGLALIEGGATVWLMIEDGHFTSATELFERMQTTFVRDTAHASCRYVDRVYPHPYVGFVHHGNGRCATANVNNVGLLNDDFPIVKPDHRYDILLTGGSVASQLAQIKSAPAPRFLEEELNRHYVSPNGKPFLVLNGADGGWKEPQPFILVVPHVQAVDAVITLGGLNEYHSFRHYERVRLEWPLSNFAEVNPLVADENYGNAAIAWVTGRIAGRLAHVPVFGRSHAVYLIARSIEAFAKGSSGWKSRKRTTIDSIFALPTEVIGDGERVFETQLELYRKYHRAIEAVARDWDVKTAYFLQPTMVWQKPLSPQEKAIPLDPEMRVALYRRIVDGMMAQRKLGMAVFDLGDVFADVKETIYSDAIYIDLSADGESLGYRLMARRMAAEVAEARGLRRKHP